MKPSWDKAPEWANYLAMDENRDWCWYENKPSCKTTMWVVNGGKWKNATPDWENTLEQRP